jgi:creatinine amidohydrolase
VKTLQWLVAVIAALTFATVGAVPASAQQRSVWIDDLTWPEVRDAIAAGKTTAIILVGSSEQNGPHMAIGKHNFIAHYCAEQIAGKLGDALVYPVIPFAITGDAAAKTAHMRFPGSVTLPPDVFSGLVRAVAQSALSAGFKLVALMGDHGGGQEEMARVAQALDAQSKKSGARVVYVGDLYTKADAQFDELLAKRGITSKELHAGIPDTSAILFLGAENWIRKDQVAAASEANGVQGSPSLATAELGKLYLDMKIEGAVNQIRAFRASSR